MPRAQRTETLLDAHEVAQRLGVSVHAVRVWTRRGRLPAVRLGRVVRYDPRSVDAVLARGDLDARDTRSPAAWAIREAQRYLAVLGGDIEIARAALDAAAYDEEGH
jgi:excisionase family DNA binding protein